MAQRPVEKLLSGDQIDTPQGGRERVFGANSPSNGTVTLTTDRRRDVAYDVGTFVTLQ